MQLAKVYATTVQYTGRFEDNDEIDLLYEGKDKWFDGAEDVEVSEQHLIKDSEVLEYENRREVRDLGNGTCEVFWCEVEKIAEDEDDE